MSVGTGKLNIIILFWKYQFHCWKYINGNQTFILDSHQPFICSVFILPLDLLKRRTKLKTEGKKYLCC
jgi:hypothetical protein